MKIRTLTVISAVAFFVSHAVLADQIDKLRLSIGPKVWFTDNGQTEAPLWGGIATVDLASRYWISVMYLAGEYDQPGGKETNSDAEVLLGLTFDYFDVGVGFRHLGFDIKLKPFVRWYTEDEIGYDEGKQRNADIFGPMVYMGSSYIFGDSPFGVYGGASWMFKDFGENSDMGFDGSHVSLEVGGSLQWRRLVATAGYRIKRYRDLPPRDINMVKYDRNTVDGFTASLRVIF